VQDEASETLGRPRRDALFFTCEHASNRVPAPWRLRPQDRRLLSTHWGYDIGARNVTLELVRLSGGYAVVSRFSRLLIDPNRDPTDHTAVLRACDDGAPTFNRVVDLESRVARFHRPFHERVDRALHTAKPRFVVSIHSFTPVFRGHSRPMEAGVLFDQHDDHADRVLGALRDAGGLRAEANEPYSGKAGLIYSANRHGVRHGVPYLEIEIRQDLISSSSNARRVARRIWKALERAGL
jgi:predicted N-formylglutamate amidohydrolase